PGSVSTRSSVRRSSCRSACRRATSSASCAAGRSISPSWSTSTAASRASSPWRTCSGSCSVTWPTSTGRHARGDDPGRRARRDARSARRRRDGGGAPCRWSARTVARGRRTARHLGGWLAARPQRGPLEVSEAGLVARIARFASKTVRDVLVPHVDVCAVPDTASVGDVVALVRERGFSRLPVFHERLFNTLGTVSSFDLLGVDPALPVTTVMRDPFFVPETKPLPELLATLQAERLPLALV